ncbi:MAG: hypothetical protein AAGA80_10805 [Cyanobacteria bacterium P01_F01_bin.143]
MNKSNLGEIELAVSQLSDEDLAKFRTWFAEFDAANWDNKFESDVKNGRLDALADKALQDLQKGNCIEL